MSSVYGDKTVAQWIAALQFDDVPERCAAALALAEFAPGTHLAKAALHAALDDMEASVQASVEIALGFVSMIVENRRRMFRELVGSDESSRQAVLQELASLAKRDVSLPTSPEIPDERFASEGAQAAAAHEAGTGPPTLAVDPGIAKVNVLPWWFLLGGVALCLLLSWLLRGVSSWKWVMAMMTVAGFFLALWACNKSAAMFPIRSRARLRFAASVFGAGAGALGILFLFPTADVLVDNASGADVRLFIDDEEWLTISTGDSKRNQLSQGKHRVTVQPLNGNQVLDAHDIHVSGYGPYVFNVLGDQVYFEGAMLYQAKGGSTDMKIVREKWFLLPKVDYLFRDPPKTIFAENAVRKTFFSKGAPPVLGREGHERVR